MKFFLVIHLPLVETIIHIVYLGISNEVSTNLILDHFVIAHIS